MLIIIDGYNFIFTVPELERHVKVNHIEPVRDHVISLLSKYKEEKHCNVTLVFDGNYTEASLPKKQTYMGITVIYSKSGISADTEIKNITSLCQNPRDVSIVTYDNDIKRHVKKCGCPIIEPKAMYKEILEVLDKDKKNKSDEPEGKRNGPSEKDAKYWKDVFKNLPVEEQKPCMKKTDIPLVKKEKKETSDTVDEPGYKYQGTPSDETQYWVRVFTETKKNEHQD
ncbi:MAG TPA: NYN domain-containing protein [Candidatus Wunengus sp. YC60]|uniref:NYN domain-containing protein n=1 Tax=Candidatus Wunengus sp. YC60 TaxID=3367697 RepID=UPI00402865E3